MYQKFRFKNYRWCTVFDDLRWKNKSMLQHQPLCYNVECGTKASFSCEISKLWTVLTTTFIIDQSSLFQSWELLRQHWPEGSQIYKRWKFSKLSFSLSIARWSSWNYFSCKVPNLRASHHFLMKSIKVATFTSKVLVETPSTSGNFHTLTLLGMVKDHGSDGPLVRNCGGTLWNKIE